MTRGDGTAGEAGGTTAPDSPAEPPGTSGPIVEVATSVTAELEAAAAALVPQLSSSAPTPGADVLRVIVESPTDTLFIARRADGEPIAGMLTLVTYLIPTGLNAVIEDVVVDQSVQRSGIGTALVLAALAEAERRGARHVDLTSRPSREEANRLYVRLGFEKRATNVYRYRPAEPAAGASPGTLPA